MRYLLLLAVLGGCAYNKELTLPDGSQGYRAVCDGTAQTMGDCYELAGKTCGEAGYTAFGESQDRNVAHGGYIGPVVIAKRELFYRCN